MPCQFPEELYAQGFGCTPDQRFSGYTETRTRLPDGTWGEWGSAQGGCVSATGQDAATPAQIGAWMESELRTLQVVPSPLHVQPDREWTFVNVDAIVYTTRDPQVLTTEVLGQSVSVRLRPVKFVWDFGDGSAPIVTTDPGAPYPNHTVSHPYTRLGTVRVSVHTTWSGEFQVAGDLTWRALSTTATTTTTTPPIEIVEARSRLVEDPLPSGR
ncbi:MAG: PKD domain-containing protein [Cellulomonadaceae bacterium]